MLTLFRQAKIALGHFAWCMSAERISFFVLFPLMILLCHKQWWVLLGVCCSFNFVVLVYKSTIGNIRLRLAIYSRELQQDILDEKATRLVEQCISSQHQNQQQLIVFIRPFAGDRAIFAKRQGQPTELDAWPIETRLSLGFKKPSTMVAFSPVKEPMHDVWGERFASPKMCVTSVYDKDFESLKGWLLYNRPGQYTAPTSDWFPVFKKLAQAASLIVCIPLDASIGCEFSATLQEIVFLSRELIERCVFVMPPDQEVWMLRPIESGAWVSSGVKLSTMWEETRQKLAVNGILLPPFDNTSDGVYMFRMYNGGTQIVSVPTCDLSSPHRYLQRLGLIAMHRRA